ncbi:MAG TPA: anthranilate synthase component I [Gammaproteobacteria bacterium]|nr:anthranilate synthase component I [Gammaproteobacteria bacterium]
MTPLPQSSRNSRADYTHTPVVREVVADLDTPLSVFLKLANGPHTYLLESVQGGEVWGRYSVIGLRARTRLVVDGDTIRIERDGAASETVTGVSDPLNWLERYRNRYRVEPHPDLPRFTGGLVGYFGYDIVRSTEPRLAAGRKAPEIDTPDCLLMVSDELAVFDNLAGKLYLIVHAPVDVAGSVTDAEKRLDELAARLRQPLTYNAPATGAAVDEARFQSAFPQPAFEAAVERAREYILAGDVMQVVLSQRMSAPFAGEPLNVYRALRSLNPSPYLYFMDFGDFQVAGSSPEVLVRVEDGEVTVRPIAGTRRRGASAAEDAALAEELLADPKERAEHLMLIDLGRNDVGRISATGSVRVTEQMVIERYSHVMHIVSNVAGRLRDGLSAIDALRACFPAGTLSGAAKVRAMEIIDELEPVRREVYSGAVGYLGWSGNMDTAIAIRTAVIRDGRLYVQVGAGIVHDSVPAKEWEETMNKGRAVFRAVELAGQM